MWIIRQEAIIIQGTTWWVKRFPQMCSRSYFTAITPGIQKREALSASCPGQHKLSIKAPHLFWSYSRFPGVHWANLADARKPDAKTVCGSSHWKIFDFECRFPALLIHTAWVLALAKDLWWWKCTPIRAKNSTQIWSWKLWRSPNARDWLERIVILSDFRVSKIQIYKCSNYCFNSRNCSEMNSYN